jgi:hypothetical protein
MWKRGLIPDVPGFPAAWVHTGTVMDKTFAYASLIEEEPEDAIVFVKDDGDLPVGDAADPILSEEAEDLAPEHDDSGSDQPEDAAEHGGRGQPGQSGRGRRHDQRSGPHVPA